MQIAGLAKKVTIYIGESDKWQHKPLYMAILEMLKEEDCAGATVTRALAGFGAHSRIHTASLVDLSTDLPLIIEWIDNPARVERVMPRLQAMIAEGLITVQDVEVIAYSHRHLRDLPATVPVQDIMSREVQAVQADTPLGEAIKLLLDKTYRALPVVDQAGRVSGILTEGDLLDKAGVLATTVQQGLTKTELDRELQRLSQAGRTVGEIMTPDPITVSSETTVPEAVRIMSQHQVKRLPVVDAGHKLVGIVSRVDVLRALSQAVVTERPRQLPLSRQPVTVDDIMTASVPTVRAKAPLAEIVDLLVSHVQRRVIVLDEAQQVAGIITDGDLLDRATAAERSGIIQSLSRRLPLGKEARFHLSQRTAAEVMTAPVITVTAETALLPALQLLLTHHIKRLPVVDADGHLLGLVGRSSLLHVLAAGAGLWAGE